MRRLRRLVPVLLAFFVLAAAALVRSPPAARSQESPPVVPHGDYGGATDDCRTCHTVHLAPSGEWILNDTQQRNLCYACHDGTDGVSDVKAEFGEDGTPRASTHPVPSGVQLCSDCHTPHKAPTEDTNLLRTGWGGTYTYSPPGDPIGNDFCLTCHGPTSPLPPPEGDHSGFTGSAHDDPSLDPPVGATGESSQIRCLGCHESHGSDQPALGLVGQPEEQACYTCHTTITPNTSGGASPPWPEPWPGSDLVAAFATPNDTSTADGNGVRVFHHPIASADQAGGARRVECSSCHNPHLVDAVDTASTSKISDPTWVRSPLSELYVTWDTTKGYMNAGPEMTVYCTRCHVAPSATAPIDAGAFVPYDIRLANDTGTDADTRVHDKFTASEWTAASPHAQAGLTCTACHDFHGSTNAYVLRERIDDVDSAAITTTTGFTALNTTSDQAAIQGFCLSCHQDRGTGHGSGRLCTRCHYHTSGRL